jgi:hypothetical protein
MSLCSELKYTEEDKACFSGTALSPYKFTKSKMTQGKVSFSLFESNSYI